MRNICTASHERFEGILQISSAEWFANYVLAPVLKELTRRHPASYRQYSCVGLIAR
jgi:DNA-binding transcriptional LysR family regulator